MNQIIVKDKKFEVFIRRHQIEQAVTKIAEKINSDFPDKKVVLLPILNGSFMFAADLFRNLTIDCEVSFLKLASYNGTSTTGVVQELIGLDTELKGKIVVVVEDIVDTGTTVDKVLKLLAEEDILEVRVASLLFKPEAFKKEFAIDYVGIEIPNEFVVGYGLDYDGFARNLPDIYKIVKQ